MLSRKDLWIVENRETGEWGLLATHPNGNYCFVANGSYIGFTAKKPTEARTYSIAEILVLFRPRNRAASRLLKASLELMWGPTFDNDTLPLFPELEKTDG
jgi:hypothetical protein